MKTCAYIRVSTTTHDQTTDNQRKLIEDAGFAVDEWYSEDGVSGTVKALQRPAFSRMMADAVSGDTCICTMVDRLGRDAEDILNTINEFTRLGIRLRVLQFDGVDVTSSMGKMIVTVMAAMSEMERNMLVERTKAGIARTRAAGTRLGAKLKITPKQMEKIFQKRGAGETLQAIANATKIPLTTIALNLKTWEGKQNMYEEEYMLRAKQHKANRERKTKATPPSPETTLEQPQ